MHICPAPLSISSVANEATTDETLACCDTYSDTYSDLYGVWRWQPYPDTGKHAQRFKWYCQHVEGEEVLAPFTRALEWLETQPEVDRKEG
jgi:hypothetical protein